MTNSWFPRKQLLFACYKIIFVWKEDSFLSIFWSLQIKYLKNLYFVERYMNVKMEMQSMMKKKSFWKQDTLIKISPLINCNFIVVASSNNDIHVSVHSLIKINNAFFIKLSIIICLLNITLIRPWILSKFVPTHQRIEIDRGLRVNFQTVMLS